MVDPTFFVSPKCVEMDDPNYFDARKSLLTEY